MSAPTVSNRLSPAQFAAGVGVIARRELAAYFDSAIAYVVAAAFIVLANSIFMNEFFLTGTVDMTGFFELLPLLFCFFLPAVTMRLWAEERRQRTIELLLTLPITTFQAALGKYLAALGLFCLFLAGSLPIVLMLFALGSPDAGLIVSGYLGAFLLGAFFLAFGSLLSALSGDQIVAFVLSTVVGFLFVLSGDNRVVEILDGLLPGLDLGTRFYESFSVMPHYDNFVRGVVKLSSLLYFSLLPAAFLWITALVLERNRT